MRTGGPERQTARWWKRNGRRASMSPHRITIRSGPINRRDVDRYRRNPNARATGGDPVCVVKLTGGGYFAREGAHRITAAREEGRRIAVRWVHEDEEQTGDRRSWWSW